LFKKNLMVLGYFLLVPFWAWAADETITLTTYYPSPYGSYNQLYIYDRLGIGTVSPAARLHLYNTAGDVEMRMTADGNYDPIFRMTGQGGVTSEGLRILYDNSVGDTYFDNIYTISTNAFHFQSGGTDRVTIQNSGNTGIGTTDPFVTLHARSNASTGPVVLESYDTYDTFSVLPWASITYLGSGVYYKNGVWYHDAQGTYNCLLGLSGSSGGRWYASSNSSPSWNLASNVCLWTAAGVLQGASSRVLKENFSSLDPEDILERIDKLDISRWSYKSEGSSVTHIGPTAESFYGLFKAGNSDKSIGLIDEAGVALTGVKGLLRKVETQQKQIRELEERIRAMETMLTKDKDK